MEKTTPFNGIFDASCHFFRLRVAEAFKTEDLEQTLESVPPKSSSMGFFGFEVRKCKSGNNHEK